MRAYILIICICGGLGWGLSGQGNPLTSGEDGSAAAAFEAQYKNRVEKEYLDGVYIPVDVQEALDIIIESSESSGRARLKGVSEDAAANGLRRRLGKWITVRWGFYEGSRLSHYIKTKYGVSHPEDMSEMIVRALYRRVNNRSLDLDQLASFLINRRADARARRLEKVTEVLSKRKVPPESRNAK